MQKLTEILKAKKPSLPAKSLPAHSFQDLALSIIDWFKPRANFRAIIFAHCRRSEAKMRGAFALCKELGKKDIRYFLAIIKKK